MKSLTVNGVRRPFAAEAMPGTLAELLDELGLATTTVVAEVDGAIVPPERFASTPLADGQSIELIQFMGGG